MTPDEVRRVVTLGGGTGTFVLLSGLRRLPGVSLSAIVTSADDGGSTGRLRDAYGFLPPGDVRQALVALAEDGNVLRDLFAYRFEKGDVAGHSLGNLFLTALADLTGGGARALEEASSILRIEGKVIPATEEPATLLARFADGAVVAGQCAIADAGVDHGRIETLSYEQPLPLTPSARTALDEADYILVGPGCLYSSTIAALLADGTKEAITASPARLIYIANLFTKRGETDGLTLSDHVREVARYTGREPDTILVHEGAFTPDVLEWYAKEGESPLVDDSTEARTIRRALASTYVVPPIAGDPMRRSLMRHDSAKLAGALSELFS
jgi:uncharacterized cofD-like protein